MPTLILVLILVVWLLAWREGGRWVRACGVTEPMSALALACVVPMSALLAAIHLPALVSLLARGAWVTPTAILSVFGVLTVAVRIWLCRRPILATRLAPPVRPLDTLRGLYRLGRRGWLWIPAVAVLATYLVFTIDAATRYPTGYDAQAYHLPMAVRWMLTQRLDMYMGCIHETFPDNGMLVPMLMAFAGRERWLSLGQLPNGILAGVTVFGLIRAVGCRRRAAWAGALIALSVPIVVFQSFSEYIDLYAAVAWLLSLLAITWAARSTNPHARRDLVILSGLAAGVALGSKTTYLLLVPLLGVVVLLLARLGTRVVGDVRRSAIRNATCFAAASLACSGFWFIRGTVQAGNPVYPLAVRLGDHDLLPGYTAGMWFPERTFAERVRRWWDYPWRETKYTGKGYPYGVNNGLGAAYAAFVPLGVLVGAATFLRHRRRATDYRLRGLMTVLALGGVVLVLTLFEEMLRFTLPLVIVGVVASAGLIDRLLGHWRCPMIAVVGVALACTAAVAAFKPAHALAGRIKDGVWDRAAFYEIPDEIDRLPPGSVILNLVADDKNYALLGRQWANRVVSPGRWHETYGDAPLSPAMLREHRVDFVYVASADASERVTGLALELIVDTGTTPSRASPHAVRLYRVLPGDSDTRLAGTPPRPPASSRP